MKKLFIVDVSSLFFRAFYAIKPLTNPQGLPVNAIYGFLSMIVKLLKDEKPDYMAFCYDVKEPSFRKEIYPEYKMHRTEVPPELLQQIPYIKKIASLLGISSFEKIGYEADDLIGTISEWATQHEIEVIIVSGDKDFAQIVRPHVYLYDTMKETRISADGVIEKWGVEPKNFCDYLALMGDSSDNVPGVSGIGPKGAQKLIQEHQNLDGIYHNIESIAGKLKEKLIKDKEMAYLSKKLVTIETKVPIDLQLDNLALKPFNKEDLKVFLEEMNFKTFLKTLLNDVVSTSTNNNTSTEDLFTSKNIGTSKDILLNKFLEEYHTTSNYFLLWKGHLYAKNEGGIFHLVKDQFPLSSYVNKIKWRGFDLKSVWKFLNLDIHGENSCPEVEQDTMLVNYVLKSKDSTELEKVIKSEMGQDIDEESNVTEIFSLLENLIEIQEKFSKKSWIESVLKNIEYPLIFIIYKMEKNGFKINRQELNKYSEELQKKIEIIEARIHEMAGEKFNVASPKQLGQILFNKLGLEALKKTKTGFSTDTDVLEKLNHPIAHLILEYREMAKLKSTYVDVLPELANLENDRVYTTMNQALTTTGRLSSSHPNLQNIPVKTEAGQRIRKYFIAEKNQCLLSLDYSQIELRILAHFSDDPGLIKAFQDNLDIHAATAAQVFGVSLSEVTSEQRRIAKAVNFGIAYGQGSFGLSESLGISRAEASEVIKNYFTQFAKVKNYIEDTTKSAYEKSYVETLFGRRRYIHELQSKNVMIKKFGERAAINAPIQGTASDIVKLAMINLEKKVKIPLLLQVHDELIFEEHEEVLRSEVASISEIMENVVQLKVPLKVNAKIGSNWDEVH